MNDHPTVRRVWLLDLRRNGDAPRSADRAFRRFIVTWWSACSILALLSMLQVAFTARPVFETDEAPHMSYAIEVANFRLPTIDTPMLSSQPENIFSYISGYTGKVDEQHQTIWTANHPPLYYVLSAPLVWIGEAFDMPGVLSVGMRLLNSLATAVVVFLTGLLARELAPDGRVVQVLAPVFVLMFRCLYFNGGLVFNDGLGVALTTGLLILTARTLRTGRTTGTLVPMALLGSAAALTRVSALPVIAISLVAILISQCVLDRSDGRGQRALRAVVWLGVTPAVVSGWFYLRNLVLYGDITASAALLAKFGREPRPQFRQLEHIGDLFRMAWERFFLPSTRVQPGFESWYGVSRGLAVFAVAVLVVAIALKIRSLWRGRMLGQAVSVGRPNHWIIGAVLVANCGVGFITLQSFVAAGGGLHPRYLATVAPIIAFALALSISYVSSLMPAISARLTVNIVIVLGLTYSVLNQAWFIDWLNTALHQDEPLSSALLWGGQLVLALAMGVLGSLAVLFGNFLHARDRQASLLDPAAAMH